MKTFLKTTSISLCLLLLSACSGSLYKGSVQEAGKNEVSADYFTDDDPVWGDTSAPISMVVFSDFECPYCAEFYKELKGLEKDWINNGKLRIQYRDFPLGIHDHAVPTHLASNAARKQGKYWDAHRKLYMEQEKWTTAEDISTYFIAMTKDLNLDEEQFLEDMEDEDLREEIFEDRDEGRIAGVTGTPAFLINGVLYRGALSSEEIAEELRFIEKSL